MVMILETLESETACKIQNCLIELLPGCLLATLVVSHTGCCPPMGLHLLRGPCLPSVCLHELVSAYRVILVQPLFIDVLYILSHLSMSIYIFFHCS